MVLVKRTSSSSKYWLFAQRRRREEEEGKKERKNGKEERVGGRDLGPEGGGRVGGPSVHKEMKSLEKLISHIRTKVLQRNWLSGFVRLLLHHSSDQCWDFPLHFSWKENGWNPISLSDLFLLLFFSFFCFWYLSSLSLDVFCSSTTCCYPGLCAQLD